MMNEGKRAQARAVIQEIASYHPYTTFKLSGTARVNGSGILWINCPGGLDTKQVALGRAYRELLIEYLLTPPAYLASCVRCKQSMTGVCNAWGIWVCACYRYSWEPSIDDLLIEEVAQEPPLPVAQEPTKKKKPSEPRKYKRPLPEIRPQEAQKYWVAVESIK